MNKGTNSHFFPYVTDRKEKTNQYENNVNLHAIDIPYDEFQTCSYNGLVSSSGHFGSCGLEMFGEKRKVASELVIVALQHMVQISNSNLVRNADSLIFKMDSDSDVKCVGKSKVTVDNTK